MCRRIIPLCNPMNLLSVVAWYFLRKCIHATPETWVVDRWHVAQGVSMHTGIPLSAVPPIPHSNRRVACHWYRSLQLLSLHGKTLASLVCHLLSTTWTSTSRLTVSGPGSTRPGLAQAQLFAAQLSSDRGQPINRLHTGYQP